MHELSPELAERLRAQGQTFAAATKIRYDQYRQIDLILDTNGYHTASVMVPVN